MFQVLINEPTWIEDLPEFIRQNIKSKEKPKAYCCECSSPIYYSIDPTRKNRIVCHSCIDAKVRTVALLEAEWGVEFANTKEYKRLEKEYGYYQGKRLKEARKKKHWTQGQLAHCLEVSRQFVSAMESGEKPLTADAISFIDATLNTPEELKRQATLRTPKNEKK